VPDIRHEVEADAWLLKRFDDDVCEECGPSLAAKFEEIERAATEPQTTTVLHALAARDSALERAEAAERERDALGAALAQWALDRDDGGLLSILQHLSAAPVSAERAHGWILSADRINQYTGNRCASYLIDAARSLLDWRQLATTLQHERNELSTARDAALAMAARLGRSLGFAVSGWRSGERPDCGCEGCREMDAALSASSDADGWLRRRDAQILKLVMDGAAELFPKHISGESLEKIMATLSGLCAHGDLTEEQMEWGRSVAASIDKGRITS